MEHFPSPEGQRHSTMLRYAGECVNELKHLKIQDCEKWMELNIFAAPVHMEPADTPDNLQHEIIQL